MPVPRVPAPPPGFVLESAVPPPPPGFELVSNAAAPIPGMEKLGGSPPPAATFTPNVQELPERPGIARQVADVTLGAVGRGIGNVIEGAGGVVQYMDPNGQGVVSTVGKKIQEAGQYLSEPPAFVKEDAQRPDRWTNPAFYSNLGFEGAGSSLATLVPGLAAGNLAAGAVTRFSIPVLRKAAAYAAGTGVGAFLESLVDAGSAYNKAVEEGHGVEKANALFEETMKRQVPVTIATNLVEYLPLAKSVLGKAVQAGYKGVSEGVEEVAQGVAQRSAENAVLGNQTPLMEGAPEEFVGGILGGAMVHGGRAVLDRAASGKPQAQATPVEDVDVDPASAPVPTASRLAPASAPQIEAPAPPTKPTPGVPPKAYIEKAPIPAPPAGFELVGPRQVEGSTEPQRLIAGPAPEKPSPRTFRTEEGMFYEEQPDGTLRGVRKPKPGTPPAGYLEEGPRFHMPPATKERGNKNPIASQGPIEAGPADVKEPLPLNTGEEANPETKTKENHEFASTQVNLPDAVGKHIIAAGARIPEAKLSEKGREDEPHVTVKYGLHGEDPEAVRKVLMGEGPVKVRLGKASLFKTEDGDVLKVDVESPDLARLNEKISKVLPNTNTHGAYKPHVTIAYLKAGEGAKYDGKPIPGVSGKEITLDTVQFSDKSEAKTEIPLNAAEEPWQLGQTEWVARVTKNTPHRDKWKAKGQEHRRIVEDALYQAKPVPPQVLWSYPDLREKYERGQEKFPGENGTEARVTPTPQGYSVSLYDTDAGETVSAARIYPDADRDRAILHAKRLAEGKPEPEVTPPQQALVSRLEQSLTAGEDLRTKLRAYADEAFGGDRASGAYTMRHAYEAQEAAVNLWMKKNAARLMAAAPEEAIKELRSVQGRLATQTVRSDEQIRKQQFSTPPAIAYVAQKVAAIAKDDSVLEPSGGTGGLASLTLPIAKSVHLNEIDPERAELARSVGFENQSAHDGEIINALLDTKVKPSVVVMNPPFSSGALKNEGKGADTNRSRFGFNHVESALQRLAPGGRLVAILSGGLEGHNQGARLSAPVANKFWERMAKQYNIRANVGVPGKEYSKYGTSFPTRVVVIDKSGPTPGSDWLEQQRSVTSGDFENLEAVWNALAPIAGDRTRLAENTGPVGKQEPGRGVAGTPEPVQSGAERKPDRSEPDREKPRASGSRQRNPQSDQAVQRGSDSGASREREPEPQPANAVKPEPAGRGEGTDERGYDLTTKRREKTAAKEDTGAFVLYEPTLEGTPHPGAIVETKSMATVNLPPLTYEPKLPRGAKISNVQLESVVLAGQQNDRRNGDGTRGAALIGDGTGVGKGRTTAAMILDNWNHGRKRLLWVSENWRLIEDARRDLAGIGADDLAKGVVGLNKLHKKGDPISHQGVIFTTYDLLRSKDAKGNTVASLVEQWLKGNDDAEGAFVAFDEAHEMKNTVAAGRAKASQIGTTTHAIRKALPNLRTVFLSATSATEVTNMGYLERMGLWGPKTPFPNGFPDFVNQLSAGGIATMELIAREMKARGQYIARSLSYKGVTYKNLDYPLNPGQKEIYRKAAKAWRDVTELIEEAVKTVNGGREARTAFMNNFWSAHQRFFNVLVTALKTPAAIELAEQGLADGKSVVITLTNTNEAAQNRQEAKLKNVEEGEDVDDLDFGPKDILLNLVREHYPVQQYEDAIVEVLDENGKTKQKLVKKPVTRKDPETGKDVPVVNPTAVAARDKLVADLNQSLHVPENPLDILISTFGRDNVAELTGRQKYYDAATGKFVKRGADLPRQEVNLAESRAFQQGKKRVAILSQAAGTGISLHAGNDVPNKQVRLHITLQPGWSADKAMQMMGRTHRTNQKQPPEYVTIVSDLSGEKRFVSTIAKRMASLGALTRGSAEASGVNMENVNFESEQGRQAATAFIGKLRSGVKVPGTKMEGWAVLKEMGLIKKDEKTGEEYVPEDAANITRILNRLLALDPDQQSAVFEFYNSIFEAAVQQAADNGTLDTGVKELKGTSITIKEQRPLSADPETGAETLYYPVDVAEKLDVTSPEELAKQMKRYPNGTFYINTRSKQIVFAREAEPIITADGQERDAVRAITPASKVWAKREKPVVTDYSIVVDLDTLVERELKKAESDHSYAKRRVGAYETAPDHFKKDLQAAEEKLIEARANAEDRLSFARQLWETQFDEAPKSQTQEYHLIGGAVLRWWNTIKEAQAGVSRDRIVLAKDSKTGNRVVGAVIPAADIQRVLAKIQGGKVQINSSQVIRDVLSNGTTYELEGGVRVTRGYVSRQPVVQLRVADPKIGRALQDIGVVYERGITPIYYIPTKNADATLDRVLARFPAADNKRSSEAGFINPSLLGAELINEGITKAGEALRDFYDAAIAPMGSRIRNSSERLADMLEHARDVGDVMAGGFLNRLIDAELNKLSRDEKFLLLDVLEGRATRAPQKIVDAFRILKQLRDDVADIALALNVEINTSEGKRAFVPIANHFPHVIRRPEALKSGPVRKDVITNLVRTGVRADDQAAEEFLDEYLKFVEKGIIAPSLVKHLVSTGQVKNAAEAMDRLRRYRNSTVRHGSLEYAREVDLPFYDPDPARVLPFHYATAGERLAQIAEFGQNDQKIKEELLDLAMAGENDVQIRKWVDRIFRGNDEGDTAEERASRFLRTLQSLKLGIAFIPNSTQAIVNGLASGDMRAVVAGYRALLKPEGRRFAVESGAAIDPVLHEAHQGLNEGRLGRFMQLYLTPFQLAEQHNRIVAANAGADFAVRLAKIAEAGGVKAKWARRQLADLGINHGRPIGKGDLLMAAKKFSDRTQFRTRPENLPAWSTTPWGKVVFQFKSFAYAQARFAIKETLGEIGQGYKARDAYSAYRGLRNLFALALLSSIAGELARALRELINQRPSEFDSIMQRVAKDASTAGGAGITLDYLEAVERGKEFEWLAGPGAAMGVDAGRLGWTWINPEKDLEEKKEATKKFYYRHGPLGSTVRGVVETK